jgi:hypothetical protein
VLYIAARTAGDESFGRTKLAKVLFYSDFVAYRDEGQSLTGTVYIRMPFGPFPRDLELVENDLAAHGRAELRYEVEEYEEKRIVAIDTPRPERYFEPWQLQLVDMWIQDVSSASSRRISDLSHQHPGWILAGDVGAVIPYESAYAGGERPPNQAVEIGRRLARDHEWP